MLRRRCTRNSNNNKNKSIARALAIFKRISKSDSEQNKQTTIVHIQQFICFMRFGCIVTSAKLLFATRLSVQQFSFSFHIHCFQ